MADCNRCAKINVKVLAILILIAVALGASLIAARHVRRELRSEMELKAGLAAFNENDWFNANRHLSAYTSLNPDEVEILKKLAKARVSIRPSNPGLIGGAIAAYRRVLALDPEFEDTYDQLAMLYKAVGNFEELDYIAQERIELKDDDDDRKAQIWLADARIQLGKLQGTAGAEPNDYKDLGARRILDGLTKIEPSADEPPESAYVQACIRMSSLAARESNPEVSALEWLTRAIEHSDPNSVEALASRASLLRESNDPVGARKDLEKADQIGTENPRIRAFLCEQWMQLGDPDRAAGELAAVEKLRKEAPEIFDEHYLEANEWALTRFILASELAMRSGDPAQAASLADDALEKLKEQRYRGRILETAIISYAFTNRPADANSCLGEYLDATRGVALTTEGTLMMAYLKALVARVKGLPYEVINILQPILVEGVSDSSLWRLLAEAYSMTGQPRQAISALKRYLVLQPNDSQVRLQKAAQHLRLGDWSAVREEAQRIESLNPAGTEANLVAQLLQIEAGANIAVGKGQAGAATLEELRKDLVALRSAHPDRVDIRILQAAVADGLRQPEDAEVELRQAIEDFEGDQKIRAQMQLVRHYRSRRDPNGIELCRSVCESRPELVGPWLELSNLHMTIGDSDSARLVLKDGLSKITDDAAQRGLSMRLALLEVVYGDRAEGREILEELRRQDEDKRDVQVRSWLLGLPEVLDDQKEAEELIAELRKAEGESGLQWRFHRARLLLESDDVNVLLSRQAEIAGDLQYCIDADPNWTEPVLALGDMYNAISDPGRAEGTYRRALTRGPAAPQVVNALIGLLGRRGRLAEAGQLIDRLRDQFRISPEAASEWNLRLVSLGSGDPDQAIEELKLRAANMPNDANLPSMLARVVYSRYGDFDRANKHLDKAKAIDPNCVALVTAEVAILRAEGRSKEARAVLDRYVTNVTEREVFNAYVLRAAYLAEVGETDRAEEDYRELPRVVGRGATGWFFLGDFYVFNRDFDKAVKAFEEGLEAYPGDLRLKRGLVKALYGRGGEVDLDRADEILADLERQLPHDPELLTIQAKRLLDKARLTSLAGADPSAFREQAEEKLRRAVRLEPTAIEAQLLLIRLVVQKGKDYYRTARDIAVRGVSSNPRSPELAWESVGVDVYLHNWELATQNTMLTARLSAEILLKDPNNLAALDTFIQAAQRSEDDNLCQNAMASLKAYLLKDPNNLAALDILVRAAQRSDDDDDLLQNAIARLEAYCDTEQGRNDVGCALALAELYRLTDDTDQAKRWVERAEQMILTDQIKVGERLSLAGAMYKAGDAEGAKKLYEELLGQDPNNLGIRNNLAWVLQEHDGDYEVAMKLADAGVQNAEDDEVLRLLLDTRGTILAKMNRLGDARKDFERVLSLSPTPGQEAKARLQLGRICDKLGESAEARRHLETAQMLDRQNRILKIFTDDERSEISRILQGNGS